jgi:hypothetical protein
MKTVRSGSLVCVLIYIVLYTNVLASTHLTLLYQSPKAGSSDATPRSTIIVRPGPKLKERSVISGIFLVRGFQSGSHAGVVHLSDDERTIIFTPDKSFDLGETVTVAIRAGLIAESGTPLGDCSFSFTVTRPADEPMEASLRDALATFGKTSDVNPTGLPASFPVLSVPTDLATASGAIFLSNVDWENYTSGVTNYLMVLHNDGTPDWYRAMPGPCINFTKQPNGLLTYFDSRAGKIYAMDSTYTIVDSFSCGNGRRTNGQECQLLANHHVLLLSYDTVQYDMSKVVSGGDAKAKLVNGYVQELDASRAVVFEWDAMQHFNILDATGVILTSAIVDPFHINSVALDSDGTLIISSSNLSEVTKISRDSGGIIWRLGGVNNQFTFIGDTNTLPFNWQNDARPLSSGTLTLLDDGYLHSPPYSRAVEYRLDEKARRSTLVWQYRDTLAADSYVSTFVNGNVQRLPNGNTLIGWGLISTPSVTEVRPDGTKVYELSFQPTNASFRAFRFPWQGSERVVMSSSSEVLTLHQTYPNPVGLGSESMTISYSLSKSSVVTLVLLDVLGRERRQVLSEFQSMGEHTAIVSATDLPAGTYFYQLTAGSDSRVGSLVVAR